MLILLSGYVLSLLLLLIKLLPSMHPLPTVASEMSLLLVLLCKEMSYCSFQWAKSSTFSFILQILPNMHGKKKVIIKVEENVEEGVISVLDLPNLALEKILGKLSSEGLSNMALVCSSMRDLCRSDHLWERHMMEKWGRILGKAAHGEWQRDAALRQKLGGDMRREGMCRGWIKTLCCFWPLSWLCLDSDTGGPIKKPLHVDSVMAWYLTLENGKLWFPAQVYNRENGHVGFMLSCYDAELCYDRSTDTFFARYPPQGRRNAMIEDGVTWDRIRVSPVDTPATELHISDCLNDLCPGDHIEIQWRRNKEFPYGWWYGVVGHTALCDQNELHCRCFDSDMVVLEFRHYVPGSRWRRTFIDRKDHREKGNETDGFYGGIRKIQKKEQISTWQRFWPNELLE